MKLKLEVSSTKLLIETTNAGALIESLGTIQCLNQTGYGRDSKYTVDPTGIIELTVLPASSLEATPDPIVTLQKEKAASDSRWVEYYNKANKAEKELAELKADLVKRGIIFEKESKS